MGRPGAEPRAGATFGAGLQLREPRAPGCSLTPQEGRGRGAGGRRERRKGRRGWRTEHLGTRPTGEQGKGGAAAGGDGWDSHGAQRCRGRGSAREGLQGKGLPGAAGAPGYAGAEWVWAGGAGGLTAGGRGHQVPASRVELAVQAHGSGKRVGVGGQGTEDAQRAAGTGTGPGCL